MKAITLAACMWMLVMAPAQAPIDNSTPIPTVTGTVTAFSVDQTVDVDIAATVHQTYRLARALKVIGSDGSPVDAATVTPGITVTLHFMQDYDDFVVDRIFLQ